MKHKKVMRRNLTATALAGVIVTAAVSGLTGYYSAQAALTQEATKYLSQLRDSTSQMISAWFSERVLEVQSLARDNTIEEFLANGDDPDPASAASQRLVEVVSLSPWYEAISLADTEGLVVAASDAHVVGNLRVPDRDYFTSAMAGETFISSVEISRGSGNPVFFVATPVMVDGATLGVLTLVVDVGMFNESFVDPINVGETGYVVVYADDGTILVHPDLELVLESSVADLEGGEQLVESPEGIGRITAEGTDVVAIWSHDRETGFNIALVLDTAELSAPLQQLRTRSILFSVIVLTVFTVIVFVLTGHFIRPLHAVTLAMEDVATGDADLTRSLGITGNHEIGRLARNFDAFVAGLNTIVRNIREVVHETSAVRGTLATVAEESASSTHQIQSNVSSIGGQIENLDGIVRDSAGRVAGIASSISTLDGKIHDQTAAIEESTAAIEEMMASTKTVEQVVRAKQAALEQLREIARDGGSLVEATSREINDIESKIDSLVETNAVINQIAAQTNLLAMNAAIEAAHAGDAGRGFAVVASEIRKLAESAGTNANSINASLQDIVQRVQSASQSGTEMRTSYGRIGSEIEEMSDALDEVATSIVELSHGSEEITKSVQLLSGASVEVREGSQSISSDSEEIRKMMERVKEISVSVLGGIREIETGIGVVDRSVREVHTQSETLGANVERLTNETNRFIV